MQKKINVITLGCSKNVVDSEVISGRLAAAGWKVAFDSDDTHSGVVVINTCGFIGDAKEESIETILSCVHAKQAGLIERLYVIGCLSERYRDELKNEIPEVDAYFGARDINEVVRELLPHAETDTEGHRLLSTPQHYAYLKISEGCDRRCSFCAIPLIRGEHRSVPMEQLLNEAQTLAASGVRELIVIAQDTTYYGLDLYGERRLGTLLRALCQIEGIEWIRLHYGYPAGFPEDVVEAMRDEPKICKYLDIPLQHISDSQLASMKRGAGQKATRELITKLRERVPDIAIRTTMLVGFPGESESDFSELRAFVQEMKFERLGVFPYCEEEGTWSAENLKDDVPHSTKEQRASELMQLQAAISQENNRKMVGRRVRVIIDSIENDMAVGRTMWDSPEVDQEVIIETAGITMRPGEFHTVMILRAEEYDLYGRGL